jgi:hypothetical protein
LTTKFKDNSKKQDKKIGRAEALPDTT